MAAAADQLSPEQAPVPAPATATRSKLRYPLRSATKPKNDKLSVALAAGGPPPTATAKRLRPAITVRNSVSVLHASAKDKNPSSSASRPPRRFSVPPTLGDPPASSPTSNGTAPNLLTPETIIRSTRQPPAKKPKPDTTKAPPPTTTTRKKIFSVLSSASYWLSQIKLSESAAKHNISLGFFNLALQSGCEPAHRMRDELKSYAVRHNVLQDLGVPAKELLQSYGIVEDLEKKLKLSDHHSPAPVHDGDNPCANNNVVAADSTTNPRTGRNLQPRSLNPESPKVCRVPLKKDCTRAAAHAKTVLPAPKPGPATPNTARTLQNKNHVIVNNDEPAAHAHKTKAPTIRRSRPGAKSSLVRKSTAVEKDAPATPGAAATPEDLPPEDKENQENHPQEAAQQQAA